ncbi:uncharacterized protein K460DRAFT_320927 [Cucurbitaria berberidis CBS 394.84]|uniref:Uncharacterized protein n=1 Tax=Cucurbitaria berberidis CBS 394.84 TaxID=1168544 RepID=A0A9P4G7U8_9PLEO|nr:uncharacterized protein K460DRAFT_320927 [Cucurbitaria berberidis CBS 394.84]KAF1840646.1 hypothetical protein K460DRAFT_320927 [Cucurbitaria berberidis CBS 394.84]
MAGRIVSSTGIKTIVKSGRRINVQYTTETDTWKRYLLSQAIQDDFVKAVEKADIPANATTAIMTETQHPSKMDQYPHFTTVYLDANGNHITTKHVYPQ